MSMSPRTIAALKRARIVKPQDMTLNDLIRTPNIGITAITEIAQRYYGGMYHLRDEPWPELGDRPKRVVLKCSHRIPVGQYCAKCAADAELRT